MPESAKGAQYVESLDHARCDEKWEEVPELVRKVRKHAPARDCLTLTAEIEHAIATCSQAAPTPSDHVTENETDGADAPVLKLDVAVQVPKLVAAMEAEERPEDRFQAQACLVWLHWIMRNAKAAAEKVPKHYGQERGQQDGLAAASEWTRVCALRSVYLEANCQVRGGERDAVARTFNSALPSLTDVWTTQPAHSALRYWSELFLTECCLLVSQTIHAQPRILTEPDCLGGFRAWARYWANQSGTALASGYGFKGSVPRRQIWAEYYAVVSQILQNDLPYPTGHLAASGDDTARSQLRMELKKVEVIYQGLLFTETKFPRADEDRKEVEEFVECLMQNWVVLTGRGWKARDLGPGGREGISRGVLDSLYGAAMKTFHSTAVLRHLFMVHLGVAEFELAFKSFDAYLDLVEKSKARAEKTAGHTEPSGDDDDDDDENSEDDGSFLETMAVCISALCQYGDSEAAEKARHLASELEKWLGRFGQHLSGPEEAIIPVREDQPVMKYASQMPPGVFALAWQSIGLAHAHWANMTFDSESRGRLQDRAILCLRRSLSSEFSSAADIRGVFALALLYAEQRKLSLAIELVKAALLAESTTEEGQELYNGPYWRERALVPLWHLLALMLSARQEYGLAARTCEGAMEQFRHAHVLFGGKDDDDETTEGLVDDMDDLEKEGILEIKMTQLALLELVEGPAAAVNASRDLLALFSRLFGTSEEEGEKEDDDDDVNSVVPPKAGTLRNFRNSVFGSGRSVRSEQVANSTKTRRSVINNMPIPATHRPATMPSSAAPAIHVTNTEKKRSRSGTLRSSRARDAARPRSSTMTRDSEPFFMPMQDMDVPPNFGFANKMASTHSRQVSNGSAVSTPADLTGLDVSEVETFAALLPRVQFPPDHDERKRGALLIKVWLVISAFYRKAERFGNAQESCAEALRIVQSLETDVARDTSGTLSTRNAGWGERKSIDELLADVWCERGYVTLAMQDAAQARTEFETALTYDSDHPSAMVGLSHMLLDVYEEKWRPKPTLPDLSIDANVLADSTARLNMGSTAAKDSHLATTPLGLASTPAVPTAPAPRPKTSTAKSFTSSPGPSSPRSLKTSPVMHSTDLKPMAANPKPPPRPAVVVSLPLVDRLAARDRAHGLLSGLTKLGSGWNRAEAWFALARALEASGQPEKAKEALWWCVELADSAGAREWACVGRGGYIV